jgi:hypothetical protein
VNRSSAASSGELTTKLASFYGLAATGAQNWRCGPFQDLSRKSYAGNLPDDQVAGAQHIVVSAGMSGPILGKW